MTADNSDMLVCRISTFDFRDEARGANDVQGGNTKEAFRIIDAFGFVDLSTDWNGGIDLEPT